jgi:Ca-activated chloride channel family protein
MRNETKQTGRVCTARRLLLSLPVSIGVRCTPSYADYSKIVGSIGKTFAWVPCLRWRKHVLPGGVPAWLRQHSHGTRLSSPTRLAWTAYYLLAVCVLVFSSSVAKADSVREMLRQGNRLYGGGQYTEAINKYNEALVEQPQALEPKFNKANGYYRVDDLGEAIDLYQDVAAGSKDMALVAKAKYNLGNCFFQRGTKQRDSDLQKALDDMKTSITYWRQVLDIDPKNEKAARNIEVARLTIKDLLDQLKQQQKEQQRQQDQPQQQQQSQSQAQQDPNQPPDPNQPKKAQPKPDPNQTQPRQQPDQAPQDRPQQQQPQEQQVVSDATAQEIIDKEQQQKKERDTLQRTQYREVEKDW